MCSVPSGERPRYVPVPVPPTAPVPTAPVPKAPVTVPFALFVPTATMYYKEPVLNPETIDVCGGCGGGGGFKCPADDAQHFALGKTECVSLPSTKDVCHKLNVCGKKAPGTGSAAAYYKWNGTNTAGALTFYTDAECKTVSTSSDSIVLLTEVTCTRGLKLIPGGYATAVVEMSFGGVLTDDEKAAVEVAFLLEMQKKLKVSPGLSVEFVWTDNAAAAARRAGSSTLQIQIAAPQNVVSTEGNAGGALANSIANDVKEKVNDNADFKAALTTAAGNKEPSKMETISAAPEEDESSSGNAWWIIIVCVVSAIVIVAIGVAVYFLVLRGGQSSSPKVKSVPVKAADGAYDDGPGASNSGYNSGAQSGGYEQKTAAGYEQPKEAV